MSVCVCSPLFMSTQMCAQTQLTFVSFTSESRLIQKHTNNIQFPFNFLSHHFIKLLNLESHSFPSASSPFSPLFQEPAQKNNSITWTAFGNPNTFTHWVCSYQHCSQLVVHPVRHQMSNLHLHENEKNNLIRKLYITTIISLKRFNQDFLV